ncbi:MAG: hypothetical protein ACTSQP_22330, partial [Promethearchaeota archaeon]
RKEIKIIFYRKIMNYFIFVFNENFYEDQGDLGKIFKFPEPDKGGYKLKGKSPGSWGRIIKKVKINDKVIWTISGSSNREDKKTVWGYGTITEIDESRKLWCLESKKCRNKIKIDDVINALPKEYKDLYVQKTGLINIGFYGTYLIDEYQYNQFLKFCEALL